MNAQPDCKSHVAGELKGRIDDLTKLWAAYREGDEERHQDDLGTFNEYALSFDYVAPGTFDDQPAGYFRYQISWGGPGDEFRFYINPDFSAYHVEYWFMDWFDGAKIDLDGDARTLLMEIFEDFRDCGTVEHAYNEAMHD